MKWITAMLVMIGVVWYVANRTSLLDRTVAKDVVNADQVIPKAERAAARERSRVEQTQSVESAGADQTVSVAMTPDEVRSVWGEPTSIEKDASENEIWRYEAIGKRVVFRKGKVWEIGDL
ncbi:MAG TPA: hypothetical protein VFL12_06185 [Thermoanaerobaculia bacterium]|nr:hypothetical protein [Thermoanaerobaculia bacterium]